MTLSSDFPVLSDFDRGDLRTVVDSNRLFNETETRIWFLSAGGGGDGDRSDFDRGDLRTGVDSNRLFTETETSGFCALKSFSRECSDCIEFKCISVSESDSFSCVCNCNFLRF